MSYWYLDGPDQIRFCFDRHPRFQCRVGEGGSADELQAAGEQLGVLKLVELVELAHRRRGRAERDRQDGKLTDRCATCGARMERLGFMAWAERPAAPDSTGTQMAERLGANAVPVRGDGICFPTKREAEAWAREQLEVAQLVDADERAGD